MSRSTLCVLFASPLLLLIMTARSQAAEGAIAKAGRVVTVPNAQLLAEKLRQVKWQQNFLVLNASHSGEKQVVVLGGKGKDRLDTSQAERWELLPDIFGASITQVDDVSVLNSRGSLVFSAFTGTGTSPGQMAGLLGFTDPQGNLTNLVRTNPYLPDLVAVAPDGAIWAELSNADNHMFDPADGILAEFDSSGNALGRYVTGKSLGLKHLPSSLRNIGFPYLGCSDARVGAYLPEIQTWIEVDFKGNLTNKWSVSIPNQTDANGNAIPGKKMFPTDFFFTSKGAVIAFLEYGVGRGPYYLDRRTSTFKPLTLDTPAGITWGGISGGEGEQFVMPHTEGDLEYFTWFSLPQDLPGLYE